MSIVSSIRPGNEQGIEFFYLGSGGFAAKCGDIKHISNKSKTPGLNACPVANHYGNEVLNPIFKSCKIETVSSLYDGDPVEKYRNIHSESRKYSEINTINREIEINSFKKLVETINSGIEFIPSYEYFSEKLFEAKDKAEKLADNSNIFASPSPPFTEPHELNPRNSILIPRGYLEKLLISLNAFCNKLT